MHDSENPFAPPATSEPPEHVNDDLSLTQRKQLEIGEVVIAWEKRRVGYNAVLAVIVLLATPLFYLEAMGQASPVVALARLFTNLIALAIAANACFLAGPFVEGYLTWFFGPRRWVRSALFVSGTLFAALLAVACCLGLLFAMQN